MVVAGVYPRRAEGAERGVRWHIGTAGPGVSASP